MFRDILRRLRTRFERETDGEGTADSRFVPSALDASVRDAHGGSRADIEGELAAVADQARELEEAQHDGGKSD